MSVPDDLLPFSALPKSETALPSIGDSLSEIVRHFTDHGALGLLAIDASAFSEIERSFGGTARLGAMLSLREVVEQLIGDRLGISDLILAGETGRNEIMILLFRDLTETDFSSRELPDLPGALAQGLTARSTGLG